MAKEVGERRKKDQHETRPSISRECHASLRARDRESEKVRHFKLFLHRKGRRARQDREETKVGPDTDESTRKTGKSKENTRLKKEIILALVKAEWHGYGGNGQTPKIDTSLS